MHEVGLMTGILDAVIKTAEDAGADRVTQVDLTVGEMTEIVDEAMRFAFEILTEGTICEGATLNMHFVSPRSRCLECGAEYDHDRFHVRCPKCDSPFTELLQGREMQIDSIEIYNDDDEDENSDAPKSAADAAHPKSLDEATDEVARRMGDYILRESE
ncbi:MAG: hydrogenase maturation nickel metallochaperone HypA [Eggerthellaceae bacterium]|jgi:hydrogenase nickel incorporation protein HypA/HybF